MSEILIFQTTPEKFRNEILQDFRREIEEFKKDYQPKEPAEFLTRNEVSKLLKVDISTVHNWVKRDKLKAYSIGTRVYFKRDEVEQSLIELKK